MTLRKVGFFSDTPDGDLEEATLRSSISPAQQEEEDRVVEYLKQGAVLIASPGIVNDAIDPSAPIIGSPNILTDGVWMWPGVLAYYVKRYHVALPAEFINTMRSHDWKIPADLDTSLLDY